MATGNRGGRPAKPAAIRCLEDAGKGSGKLRKQLEVEAKKFKAYGRRSAPRPPDTLGEEAKKYWRMYVKTLTAVKGLLTPTDLPMLERYCQLSVMRDKLQREIDVVPTIYVTSTGSLKERPELAAYRAVSKQMLEMEREFGMSPAARGRMQLPQEEEDVDGMEQLLRGDALAQ